MQIIWGEQVIEFLSFVEEVTNDGIYVSPYIYNGKPLEFNIDMHSGVICNVYYEGVSSSGQVSWKNVGLTTELRPLGIQYYLQTSAYNNQARQDDRRKNERINIHRKGMVYDRILDKSFEVIVHDISDIGISFFAPHSFEPKSKLINIRFSDVVEDKIFDLDVECSIARSLPKAGNQFYGCKIAGENKNYLIYGFMKRIKSK